MVDTRWPYAAHATMNSADMREAMLGKLLFAQWSQMRAAEQMQRLRPGSHFWVAFANQQRRAYRNMFAARAALHQIESEPA